MEQHEFGTNEDLARYRLETAKDDVKCARVLYDIDEYRAANNRAYYAIFHAINAVHALNGVSYRRHKDAVANFNKEYIKTEIFPRELGRAISSAEEIRHASDYNDFYIASADEALEQIETADNIISLVEKYMLETKRDFPEN